MHQQNTVKKNSQQRELYTDRVSFRLCMFFFLMQYNKINEKTFFKLFWLSLLKYSLVFSWPIERQLCSDTKWLPTLNGNMCPTYYFTPGLIQTAFLCVICRFFDELSLRQLVAQQLCNNDNQAPYYTKMSAKVILVNKNKKSNALYCKPTTHSTGLKNWFRIVHKPWQGENSEINTADCN